MWFLYLHSPQQYLWEKEGSVPPLKMTQESALIFPFLNKSDSGTYGCTATSNMGSYKAYYTLNVNGEPPSPLHPPRPLWPPYALCLHLLRALLAVPGGQVRGREPTTGGLGPWALGPLWNV